MLPKQAVLASTSGACIPILISKKIFDKINLGVGLKMVKFEPLALD